MEDGVWRTIGGRKVYIKKGQSLSEAMKESGKFKQKETTKKESPKTKIDDKKDKYLSRGEMGDLIDKWSSEGFEEGKYKSDYGKGVFHEKYASGQLTGYGGEEDDFVIEGFDLGSAPEKEALEDLNDILGEYGYKAEYLKEGTVHQDIKISKIKEAGFEKSVNEGYEKFKGKTDKEISEAKDDLKRKYMEIPEEERVKAYEEGKSWKELINEKAKEDDFERWKEDNNEKIASYYTETYSEDLKNINEDVWNSIAKDIYDEEKLPEKINKEARKESKDGIKIDTTKLKGEYYTLPERTPEEKASDERYANAKAMYKLTGDEKYKKAYQDEIKASGERIRKQVEANKYKSIEDDPNYQSALRNRTRAVNQWAKEQDPEIKAEMKKNLDEKAQRVRDIEKKYGYEPKSMNDKIRESVNSVKREQAVKNLKRGLPNVDDKTAREYVAKLEGLTDNDTIKESANNPINDYLREKARKKSKTDIKYSDVNKGWISDLRTAISNSEHYLERYKGKLDSETEARIRKNIELNKKELERLTRKK